MQFLVLLETGPGAINRVPMINRLMAEAQAAGAVCVVPHCVAGVGLDV